MIRPFFLRIIQRILKKIEKGVLSMLKKTLAAGVVFIIGMVLSGCGDIREPSPFEEVDTLDGVSISLNQEVYDSEGETFILTVSNQSEEEISYGIAFTVEKQEGDQWITVEPEEEMSFIMIAHILGPGEEAEDELNMHYYEPFEPGEYRVVRQIEGEVLTAEFTVE